MSEIVELFKSVGPTLAITIIFVWQAVKRENRMSSRIDHLEDKLTAVLSDTVQRNTDAFHAFSHAVQHVTVTPRQA